MTPFFVGKKHSDEVKIPSVWTDFAKFQHLGKSLKSF